MGGGSQAAPRGAWADRCAWPLPKVKKTKNGNDKSTFPIDKIYILKKSCEQKIGNQQTTWKNISLAKSAANIKASPGRNAWFLWKSIGNLESRGSQFKSNDRTWEGSVNRMGSNAKLRQPSLASFGQAAMTRQHHKPRIRVSPANGPLDSLRGSSVKVGKIQRSLAWPLRKDDARKSRSVNHLRNTCADFPRPNKKGSGGLRGGQTRAPWKGANLR